MHLRKIMGLAGPRGGAALLVGMVLTLFFFACGGLQILFPRPLYYRTINIDRQSMTAELSDPFPGRDPPRAQYYSTWTGGAGRESLRSIWHYDGTIKLPYRVRYGVLHEDNNKRLVSRSKLQELLTGPYGTVYAETKYSYGSHRGSRLEVMLYGNKAEHEPMQVVGDLPSPSPKLSAISLVRVLRTHPEYGVVTAVYDPHGNLQRAGIFGSRGGDWHQESGGEIAKEHGTLSGLLPAAKKKYGLPDSFPIADYLAGQQWEWQDVGKPNPENIINLHYDYNRWVRQDAFDAAGKRTTRYLTYVVTPEDIILEAIDREVPFGQTAQLPGH